MKPPAHPHKNKHNDFSYRGPLGTVHAGGGKIALKAGTREHKRREGQNCLLALRPVPWTLSNYRQSFGSERTGPNWTFGLPERLVLIGPARPETKNRRGDVWFYWRVEEDSAAEEELRTRSDSCRRTYKSRRSTRRRESLLIKRPRTGRESALVRVSYKPRNRPYAQRPCYGR